MFDPLVTILYNKGEMDIAGNRKSHRSNRHVPQNRFIFASEATAPDKKVGKLGCFFPPLPGLHKEENRSSFPKLRFSTTLLQGAGEGSSL